MLVRCRLGLPRHAPPLAIAAQGLSALLPAVQVRQQCTCRAQDELWYYHPKNPPCWRIPPPKRKARPVKLTAKRTTTEPSTDDQPPTVQATEPVPSSPAPAVEQTEPSATAEVPVTSESVQSPRSTVQIRRSTLIGSLAAVALLGAAATSVRPQDVNVFGGNTDNAKTVTATAQESPTTRTAPEIVAQALEAASVHFENYQTFVGFSYPNTLTATAPNVFLVSAAIDGTCAFSKIEEAQVYTVGLDVSGETCMPATMQQAQVVLNQYATATAAQTGVGLGHLVSAVETAAAMYASMNYVNASPSLLGLTSLEVPNSQVVWVAPDGTAADVRINADGACRIVHVFTTVSATTSTSEC